MSEQATAQTYDTHRKLVPLYHFVALPILAINVIYSLVQVFRGFSFASVMDFMVASALVIAALYLRLFALKAQDRVIRVEERLRMARLFDGDLEARIDELECPQFVALRFAPDDELEDLTRKVLDEGVESPEAIKKLIKGWRGDTYRV